MKTITMVAVAGECAGGWSKRNETIEVTLDQYHLIMATQKLNELSLFMPQFDEEDADALLQVLDNMRQKVRDAIPEFSQDKKYIRSTWEMTV